MHFVSPKLISAAAVAVVLSFTAVQAEPKQSGEITGGPPSSGNSAGGDHPGGAMDSPIGRPDQSGAAAGNSNQLNSGKNKAAEGAMPSEGQSGKGVKDGNDTGMATGHDNNAAKTGDKGKGKSAEGALPPEGAGSKDAKQGKNEGNTAEGKSGADEDASGAPKAGTAEGEGDRQNRPGKSVRLESNDISKVRTYFSQHRPTAHRIDRNQVSVSIGVAIPSAIILYDLPPDVIVLGGACPVKYFVWEDDIVLVDSCTHEVVEIISGVA